MMGNQSKYLRVTLSLLLVGVFAVGCGDDSDDDEVVDGSANRSDAGADAGPQSGLDSGLRDGGLDAGHGDGGNADAASQLSDPQVVGVAAAVNAGEIAAGTVAQNKGANAAVRNFGAMMVMMHTTAQQRQTALGITPASSSVRSNVEAMNATVAQTLQSTPAGLAFDRVYIESQVTAHTSARNLIDTVLLPSTSTAALREELTRTRGEVVAHLAEAQEVLATLQQDGGAQPDAGADAGRVDGGADAGI